ncbi:hypothetical protein [Qipengyuania sp.]|uniref:hypothetical protein n=1 Tax=Qipengyuania sp. TaxID=2004515 RepID=UPI0035122BCD
MLENPRPVLGFAVFANRPTPAHATGRVFVTAGLVLRCECAVRPDDAAMAEASAALVGEKRAMSGINLYCLGSKRLRRCVLKMNGFFR